MKVRVKVQPSGLLSLGGQIGVPWPEVGETVDLPDFMAQDMTKSGHVEPVKAEKKAKKAAAKPDEAEKRPAAKADVETRKAEKKS